MKPYSEIINNDLVVRTFKNNVDNDELTWHRDREDRFVVPINENDWFIQMDNELPVRLRVNEEFFIPKNTFHRVIKGSTDLVVEVTKLDNFNFDDIPSDILKTLRNEYSHYYIDKFDWNSKQDEFTTDSGYDGAGFKKWHSEHEKNGLLKNLNTLISKVREDLILLLKKKNANRVLSDFEELIKPALGDSVLTKPLSKYMEIALLNLQSLRDINKAFLDAKNIISSDGSLDQSKIEQSKIFTGGDINLPAFERFVEDNPEYLGVFNDWKKLLDKSNELSITRLNAFRDSTPYNKIRELYDYLVNLRKNENNLNITENSSKFVYNFKRMVKFKLNEVFGNTLPKTKPVVTPKKPIVSPRRRRIWEVKPAVTPPGKM